MPDSQIGWTTKRGHVTGFDLDGLVSDANDSDGCFIEDYTDLNGVPGIDNAFARLIPALEVTEAAAMEPLIQSSINAGELLLTIEVSDLDDPMDDACVDVRIGAALGNPVVGADDRIVPGQTFDLDPAAALQVASSSSIVDGRMRVDVPSFQLSVSILNAEIELDLADAVLQIDHDINTGLWSGQLGGAMDSEALLAITSAEGVDASVAELVEGLLAITSDLSPDVDGNCQRLSVTLEFEAASAFYY